MLRQCYAFDSFSPWLDAGKLQKSLISGLPGGIFRALARGGTGIDPAHPQRHRQTLADLLAMALKVIGCGLQAMVDMPGLHLPRPALGTRQQLGAGVGPAAERHGQRQGRMKTGHGRIKSLGHRAGFTL